MNLTNAVIFHNALTANPTGTQELTASTSHDVLNVVRVTQPQYAKKHLAHPLNARCAPAFIRPTTKALARYALSIRSSKTVATSLSPQPNSTTVSFSSPLLSPSFLILIKIPNSYTSNSLLTLLWNANGLNNHTNELTLQEKRIDIVIISETHFTINSYAYHVIISLVMTPITQTTLTTLHMQEQQYI